MRLHSRALTLAGTGIESLGPWTMQDTGTHTATVVLVESLRRRALGRMIGALTVTGGWVEPLCLSASIFCRAFTLARIAVEPLISWTPCHSRTLAPTRFMIVGFRCRAVSVFVGALTLAGSLVENLWLITGEVIATLTPAGVIVKKSRWATVAFSLTHTPAVCVAEELPRSALSWPITNAPAQLVVESVG